MRRPYRPRCAGGLLLLFGGGAIIGALGGLIGLGSAEFRLPLLHGFLFIVRELLHTTGVSMIEGPDNAGEVPQ